MARKLFEKTKTGEIFASLTPEGQALWEAFTLLDLSAREKAKDVTPACQALRTAWDALLPILDEMHSLLSQRGKNYELHRAANLPGWGEWFKSFKRKTGLDITMRNVQLRLLKYRELDKTLNKVKPARRSSPIKWSYVEMARMLHAVQLACLLVEAEDRVGDPTLPLQEFRRLNIDRKHIERQLESIEDQVEILESLSTVQGAVAPIPVADTPILQQPISPAQALEMPKAADYCSPFTLVDESSWRQIGATVKGLPPDAVEDMVEVFVAKLAQMHYQNGCGAGEIVVRVEYIPANRSAVDRAA
jgi:hypothetical protein